MSARVHTKSTKWKFKKKISTVQQLIFSISSVFVYPTFRDTTTLWRRSCQFYLFSENIHLIIYIFIFYCNRYCISFCVWIVEYFVTCVWYICDVMDRTMYGKVVPGTLHPYRCTLKNGCESPGCKFFQVKFQIFYVLWTTTKIYIIVIFILLFLNVYMFPRQQQSINYYISCLTVIFINFCFNYNYTHATKLS